MSRVLFICSGNICRSPMAAEYARHRVAEAGLDVAIDSAGLLGIEGSPASREAVRVLMEETGVDLASHRSRGLRPRDVPDSDLIVVMTMDHLAELTRRDPSAAGKTQLIRGFEEGPEPRRRDVPDLPDPIGCPVAVYRQSLAVIRTCVDHLVTHLAAGR